MFVYVYGHGLVVIACRLYGLCGNFIAFLLWLWADRKQDGDALHDGVYCPRFCVCNDTLQRASESRGKCRGVVFRVFIVVAWARGGGGTAAAAAVGGTVIHIACGGLAIQPLEDGCC